MSAAPATTKRDVPERALCFNAVLSSSPSLRVSSLGTGLALVAGEPERFCVLDATEPVDRVRGRVAAAAERLLGGRP